jgi:hypothetical protein
MATKSTSAPSAADVARRLAEAADADTVYRDVYLARARTLLAGELSQEQYRGFRGMQQEIEDTVAMSRAATVLQDWRLVQELANRADTLRRGAQAQAALMAVGELVYDAPIVAIDPFSPGLATLAKSGGDLAEIRDKTVAKLVELAKADAPEAAFYEARRAFFGGLIVAARRPEATGKKGDAPRSIADLERFAYEAAQRGDVAELKRLADDILAQKAAATAKPAPNAAEVAPVQASTMDACPVDLGVPFATDVTARAQKLGLTVTTTQPQPEAGPLLDYVAARVGQLGQQQADTEHEGAIKIEALVAQHPWPADVSEHIKVLVAQFVRQAFINSGGARYRPAFATEAVLIEDFPEDQEPPADSPLLKALGLGHRRGLARDEIEVALLAHGAHIVTELGLDPRECRLVCVPPDVYTRFGRDHGWGAQPQWTHLDGYQVLKGGRLRALVGGDARYGGLNDLTSIAPSDQRDSVVARFAVVRRARQVARWR